MLQDGTCSLWRTNFDPASLANKELKGPRLGFVHLFFWGLGICHGKKQQPLVIQRFNMFFGWKFWCIGKKTAALSDDSVRDLFWDGEFNMTSNDRGF